MNVIARQREIVDRRTIVARLDDIVRERGAEGGRGEILAFLKQTLAEGRGEVHRRFAKNHDGRACMRASAFLIDQIIRVLYDFAYQTAYPLANPTQGERIAVVAVGGYGRGELAPFSDVDLLFVLNYKLSPHTEQVIEYILYMLWDLGLKVGHATRSTDECLRMAGKDLTIRTALLESRFLWGDRKIYAEFRRRYLATIGADSGLDFVDAKLAERDARHHKMGDTRYVLEPNIKEGKGGLRDLHTLYWIAKYLYRVDEIRDLIDKGVFSAAEATRFRKAHEFLRAVRCQLHYIAGRGEERLTFDHQQTIARQLGFNDRKGVKGVERFMKYYYLIAKEVGDLTRIFCAALEIAHRRRPRFRLPFSSARARGLEGFVAEGGWLKTASDTAFADDPLNFIRLFSVAQKHGLDIHPATLRAITQNLKKIDERLRTDAQANRLFLDILTSKSDPATALKRLNEAGVLGRFIPDFGRIVAQMQYDMYHVYTVDEHSIRAIDLLHRIEAGELADDHPLSTEIIHKVQSRRALYVATFLHDIAKGRGGQHSQKGAEVALVLGPRLGLSEEETESVAWLVRHHLDMSNTAQKRDIDDPKTIADFAAIVQSPERLKLLLVLTVADMRATGPRVWNAWKAALLRDLYTRAEEVMSGQAVGGGGTAARVEAAHGRLRERLGDWPAEAIDAHLARGYPGYWLSLDTDSQVRHAELIRSAEDGGRALVVDTSVDTGRAITEVTVYTSDHPGLFSRIAGAMALSGASIVDAKIYTLTSGKALDIFWVQDAEGGAFDDGGRLKRLAARIAESLSGELATGHELMGRESLPSRARVFAVPPRVLIDEAASATHTVIEVNGRDRPGLLYDVTRALTDLGLQISSAKISTFGERAIDVFYVKDVFGMKIQHEAKHEAIRERLMQALLETDASADPQTGKRQGESEPAGAGGTPPASHLP
ncbi:MAG: [protein-PII] uridylyltransferase [Alphaproteobacteria bacterium]